MANILDYFYGLLTAPRKTLGDITYGEKLKESFLIWIFTVLLLVIPSLGTDNAFVLQLLGTAAVMGLFLLMHCAAVDYTAGLFGGRGTARGITAGFMASAFPAGFSVFPALLSSLGLPDLNGILGFAIFLWIFYLDVTAVEENYRFGRGKSLAVALAPFLLLAAVILLLTAAGIAAAVAGLTDMQSEMNEAVSILNQM